MIKKHYFLALLFLHLTSNLFAVNAEEEVELMHVTEKQELSDQEQVKNLKAGCCTRVWQRLKKLCSPCKQKIPVCGLIFIKSTIDVYLIKNGIDGSRVTNDLSAVIAANPCMDKDICGNGFDALSTIATEYVNPGYIAIAVFGTMSFILDIATLERYLRSDNPRHHTLMAASASTITNYGTLLPSIGGVYRNLCYPKSHNSFNGIKPEVIDFWNAAIIDSRIPMITCATAAVLGTIGICIICQCRPQRAIH